MTIKPMIKKLHFNLICLPNFFLCIMISNQWWHYTGAKVSKCPQYLILPLHYPPRII